jgi:hypothetical protein
MLTRLNRIATHRDELILEERQRANDEALAHEEAEAAAEAGDDESTAEEGASA